MRPTGAVRTLVVGAATVAFVAACVLPVAYMLALSLEDAGRTYRALALDPRQRALLSNTLVLGVGAAALASALGAPLGFALARFRLRLEAPLRIVLAVPLAVPPYIMALAWSYTSDWTYSLPGAALVLALSLYPVSMLATEAALRRIDPRLEEAALVVSPPRRVIRRITLPLVAPHVAAAALVTFVLAISDFGVPGLLRVRVFTTEIFTAFAALYDFARATALALPLIAVTSLVAAGSGALIGERLITARRGALGPPLLPVRGWRWAAWTSIGLVTAVAVAVPTFVLVREASAARSVGAVMRASREAIGNSLLLATVGATFVVTIAVWLGYARARARSGAARVADVLFVVLFAVPSTVVGIGLIGLWNRPGPFGLLYATNAMIVLAYVARFVPVAALVLAAVTRQVPLSSEEAAAVGGAGWLRTLTHIVFPQMKLGLCAAWVIVFILAFGELGATILVAPPGETTLPIRIYTIIANTPASHVAALALLQTAAIVAPLALLAVAVSVRPRH